MHALTQDNFHCRWEYNQDYASPMFSDSFAILEMLISQFCCASPS
jgi:hypothetical protein